MKRDNKQIAYSYEHGDKTLPHLKDLVSDTPDSKKSMIMSYLKTPCILACPGIIYDMINPDEVIGAGNIFLDGTYIWNDEFYNYVDRYNIPVPKEFRDHIIKNFSLRMERHMQMSLVDSVEIQNNPFLGYQFNVCINKNGIIKYKNNTDCIDEIVIYIKPDEAQYIIDPIMTELFCYDSDGHGRTIIDGYQWKIIFYNKSEIIDEIEGSSGEDKWRYKEFRSIIEFAERYIPKNLGLEYLMGKGNICSKHGESYDKI